LSLHKEKIVVLGSTTRHPVAGVTWLIVQYLIGFQRLGYDVYYVEAHARPPFMFMLREGDDGAAKAAAFIAAVMRRFDLGDRWAYHALHADGHCYGLSESQLKQLYRSAALLINLHGGTEPLPEHSATGRLIYLETDPVEAAIRLHNNDQKVIELLAPHTAFFTWGLNYGNPDCKLPVSERFHFRPTCPPVVLDFWQPYGNGAGYAFTTVGNWRQRERVLKFQGEVYHWSKHSEFLKFLDLPSRTTQSFELALSKCDEPERRTLESHGWKVLDALSFSTDIDAYRQYITRSRGEFTVAKDQNVRLRSGWFSERSATYLASGRPVITQETGFSNVLPTVQGLFAFSTMEEILQAIESINAAYEHHCRRALALARQYFSYDVVLPRLLAQVGLSRPGGGRPRATPLPQSTAATPLHSQAGESEVEVTEGFPSTLVLTATLRWPTRLPDTTVQAVLAAPTPRSRPASVAGGKRASIVVVTFNNLVFTKFCLQSLLINTEYANYEVIVVDNGSTDATPAYLRELMVQHAHVHFAFNSENLGFARATNQGLALADGDMLVLLNNDTLLPPGWLTRLARHLDDPTIGLIGPVTNRTCNEAQIDAPYRTYAQFLRFAAEHCRLHDGELFDIRMLAMFCVAFRREAYESVGPLDERFEIGMFEDDDYALRMRAAGYRVVCAEGAFVHHFGQASIGELVRTGQYNQLFQANQRRFEEKWGMRWEPHRRRISPDYQRLRERLLSVMRAVLPTDATVLVVSKGDNGLLDLNGRDAWHFPRAEDGGYANCYPVDSSAAIAELEALRDQGGQFIVFPRPAFWWFEHYVEFGQHLHRRYRLMLHQEDTCAIFALGDHDS
jgi:GT2 family glycosyltransferase